MHSSKRVAVQILCKMQLQVRKTGFDDVHVAIEVDSRYWMER